MKKKSKPIKNDGIKKKSKLTKKDIDLLANVGLLDAIQNHKDLNNRSYLLGMVDTMNVANKLYGYKLRMYDFMPDVIPWEVIERTMKKGEYKRFCRFMGGQTVPEGGVYSWDLENFFSEKRFFD